MADAGVDFPLDGEGKRSTTTLNQGAWAAAVQKHSGDAYKAVVGERSWRFGYAKHVVAQTQLAATSEAVALGIARDGLAYLHGQMVFVRGGETKPLSKAMAELRNGSFQTHTVKGSLPREGELRLPYKGRVLRGDEVKQLAEQWVRRGVIELDTGLAMSRVADSKSWLDLSDHTFVLFGAGSAMGPLPILLAHGANIVAVDLARPGIWRRLIALAKDSAGTLTMPMKAAPAAGASDEEVAGLAGCDLLASAPEVRNWLLSVLAGKDKVVLGAYCYADGPLFVRVSVAMDAIIADLIQRLPKKPALAYLCTPTDAHICTNTARDAAAENLRKAPFWQPLVGALLRMGKMGLSPNHVKGEEGALPVVDAVVKEQGPNYCLAKRLQHWRAILARKEGCIVSSNIAPATATASVTSNKLFALAYKGMHHFKPMEVFEQDTSNAVMAALLVHDLRNPGSAANPQTTLANPMQLFAATAFHGGAWRTGYKFGTIGPASAIGYIVGGLLLKVYLAVYSLAQLAGWALALHALKSEGLAAGLPRAGELITRMTYLQILEVVHAATGFVPSNALTTAMQIGSRVMLVQVMNCVKDSGRQDVLMPWQVLFFVAWSITEVVRYAFYALNTVGKVPGILRWLRYSTFLVLYPMGVTGELGFVTVAQPAMAARSVQDAATCGLSGSCGWLAALCFAATPLGCYLVYAAGFPMLFGTMLAQRRKVLGRGREGKGGKGKAKKA